MAAKNHSNRIIYPLVKDQPDDWFFEVYNKASLTYINLHYAKSYVYAKKGKKLKQLPDEYDAAITTLAELIKTRYSRSNRYERLAAKLFVHHLRVAYYQLNIGFKIAISREVFTELKYPKSFYVCWDSLLQALVKCGYGEVYAGGLALIRKNSGFSLVTKTSKNYSSIFIPSDKAWLLMRDCSSDCLTECLTKYSSDCPNEGSSLFPNYVSEDYISFCIKDDDGKKSFYKLANTETESLFEDMVVINSLIQGSVVLCDGVRVDATSIRKYTKYANEAKNTEALQMYGRLFNSLQNKPFYCVSGVCRSGVTINGSPVVEIDYVANHPMIMLALAGVEVDADFRVYDVDEEDSPLKTGSYEAKRKVYKKALLLWLYAPKSPHLALHKALKDVPKDEWEEDFGTTPKPNWKECAQIIDAIKKHNPELVRIKKQYNLTPARLQNIDSKIAVTILLKLAEKDIPAIPIHDSFLIAIEHKDYLCQVMVEAWNEVLVEEGGYPINCYVDVKTHE